MKNSIRRTVTVGATVGAVSAVITLIAVGIVLNTIGASPWSWEKISAVPWIGARALHTEFELGPVLLSLITRIVVSSAWGALFGILLLRFSRAIRIPLGCLAGAGAWYLMQRGMDLAGYDMVRRSVPQALTIADCAVFAGILGIGLGLFRATSPKHATA